MKPYIGGKSGTGTYQQIINHIPPHTVYVEPCAGHGGIFRKIKRAAVSIINDIDPEVCRTWKQYPMPECDVYSHLAQSTLFEKPNKPVVIITNKDYKEIVNQFKHNPDAFIYLDPPYPIYLRRSQRKLYNFDWEGEHINLLKLTSDATAAVMISSYPNDLYKSNLPGWHTHEFDSVVRAGKKRLAREIIYFNYPPPSILHDFQYLGSNRRKRLEIKRQVARWNKNLEKMEPARRNAIISSIISNYNTDIKKIIRL
jgi:DNA adenine methylase